MEFEERNPKPEKSSSGLPMVVLFVLIGIICLLLYAGWNMMSDDASKVSELKEPVASAEVATSSSTDTTAQVNEATATHEEIHPVVEANQPAKKVDEAAKKVEKVATPALSGESTSYVVKEGETFYGIANRFNVSASTLKNANPGVDLNAIKVGVTKVTIPVQGFHTVGPGDVLRVVASKYHVTVDQLMAANSKTKNFAQRGEKLIVPMAKK